MTPIHRIFTSRALGRGGFSFAVALMGAALTPALADETVSAEALAKCAGIADRDARLICFDAVAAAIAATQNAGEEKRAAEAEADAKEKAAEARAKQDRRAAEARAEAESKAAQARAEAERKAAEVRAARAARAKADEAQTRAAEIAAREAELARREADLAQAQAEAEQKSAALETERARIKKARERQQEETARNDELIQHNQGLAANRLPQTMPILFGIDELPPAVAARVTKGLNYDQIFATKEELDRIEVPVIKYGYANTGKAYVVLEGGMMWRQKDRQRVRFSPDGPKTVEVKRGMVGTYFMRLNGRGAAIRAERIR